MQYENPQIPDGINDSDSRPLASFLKLAGAALAVTAACAGAAFLLADRLAPLIPFRYESELVRPGFFAGPSDTVIEPYLQGLAARLARAEKLPQDMAIHVHYDHAPVVNAMATLGGHVVIYQGLLEVVPHENALAMVLAHEIAHVRHRHPIASVGRAAAFSFALTTLGGDGGLVQSTIAQGGSLTMLSFSRAQEAQADATAFANLHAAYGHVAGADAFFKAMLSRAEAGEPLRFLASHPLNAQRIESLGALAAQRSWQAQGDVTQLPGVVRAEIERRRQAATKLAP